MSSLSTISIQRPVLAIVMNLIIILFGCIGYSFLGVREYPSIDPPVITVRTNYTGANAEVIQSEITEPIEKSLNGIEGVKTISSASNLGSSVITVEFNLGTNLEAAANDVRDKVSQSVRQLPQDIDGLPTVSKADANADAILSLTVQSNTQTQLEVSDFAENVLAERLQTIPGVSSVQIWGQKRYAMRLRLDPHKLAAYGITPLDIKAALDRENVELPGGKISGNQTELSVKTLGRLSTEKDFNELIISNQGDQVIRLQQLGFAELAADNEETILKQSGTPMIGLALIPQPGANYLDIAEEFYKRVEVIKKDLPKDFYLDIALDNTKFIQLAIHEVQETLIIAIFLVVLIIYLFFRDWLIAFRPLIDIPVSLIGVFFLMYLLGYSINVLTLLAIVLATGLVVDDGIVVTENIYKKIEQGIPPRKAAIEGTNEIFFAVISTSVTLIAVFIPVIFLEGFVGRLFQEFGVVLAGAVLISAFVSLTLTPMLNARLVKKNPLQKSKFYIATEPFFIGLETAYKNSLEQFIRNRWIAFLLLGISVGIIVFLFPKLPTELAPIEDRSWLRLIITAPEGASYEYTDAFLNKITDFIQDSVPEKTVLLTVTAPGFAGSGAVNTGFARVVLSSPDKRQRSQQQIAGYLMKYLSQLPEAKVFAIQQQTISTGGFGGLPVQFVIQASNFNNLKQSLPKFLEKAQQNPIFQGVDVNLKFNKPELGVNILRDRARALGVSVLDISQTLQLALSGQRFAYFNRNGKQYQVIGQLDRENRDEPQDLTGIFIRNNAGQLIQLDNVVEVSEESSPPQLYHYNRYQSATVSAGLAPGHTLGEGILAMENIAKETLDESFSTELSGASRDFKESSSNTLFAFVLALLLVYLILAAQFESFIDPLIIMLTVPLALAGAIVSLWLFNQTNNIFSQIGIIMLIGLVTKNGILIVEFANQLKEKGLASTEAALSAGVSRLRPILMTSLATVLGALPIALALGAGSQSRTGMGIVVVGGLLFSLVLTLYVIPAIYTYLSSKSSEGKHE
ncbi:MAG: efflux RND transporter permease subunit [Sphingobacteriia bacterium]|nr:efflux RND transporter permease subunit [Sphingobacteriia bacterium]